MRAAERSMRYLRELGGFVAKVEHWNQYAHIRQDLFGFADLLWLSDRIVAIQVVNTHLPEHIEKIRQNEAAQAWIACGGGLEIHNWKKRGRGKRKTWQLERIDLSCGKLDVEHVSQSQPAK